MKEMRNERTCKRCAREGGAVVFLDLIITEDQKFWICPVCSAQYEEIDSTDAGLKRCPLCGAQYFRHIRMTSSHAVVKCPECGEKWTIDLHTSEIRLLVENE